MDPARSLQRLQRASCVLRQHVPPAEPESRRMQPPSDVTTPAAPDRQPIPARMMNEFVYCQRLFYYEFVEGVFVESADTLRGDAIHQRVDSGSGALPAAKKRTRSDSKASAAPTENKDTVSQTASPAPSNEEPKQSTPVQFRWVPND